MNTHTPKGFRSSSSADSPGRSGVVDLVCDRGVAAVRRLRLYRARSCHGRRTGVHDHRHTPGAMARQRDGATIGRCPERKREDLREPR